MHIDVFGVGVVAVFRRSTDMREPSGLRCNVQILGVQASSATSKGYAWLCNRHAPERTTKRRVALKSGRTSQCYMDSLKVFKEDIVITET